MILRAFDTALTSYGLFLFFFKISVTPKKGIITYPLIFSSIPKSDKRPIFCSDEKGHRNVSFKRD